MESLSSPEPWRNTEILEQNAERHYVNLPFHNFQEHVREVRESCRQKSLVCISQGLSPDLDVIDAGALWHDAGYHVPTAEHGFRSKEQYSCSLADKDLRALGMPESKIAHVLEIIRSTEGGVACQSLEGRILRQADLDNLASSNPFAFLKKTLKLRDETKLLTGKEPSLVEFARSSYSFLQLYVSEDVSLGEFDRAPDGESWFCSAAKRNVELLISPQITRLMQNAKREES